MVVRGMLFSSVAGLIIYLELARALQEPGIVKPEQDKLPTVEAMIRS
eukprot:CAMPEP_0171964052 /NCGR_PEP_ID=MMETSP0993-20121228/179444_1 /TAXON_ID=483369 /ORGANISM="non described non described, Strain CCMP2098" /LENGTH=46 /DNA_ID= /DNA_START= /DNA_END= /DNA_ORIENTATION=